MITVDSVTVVYGRTIALDDVSLQIHPGVTGLFGQNGSGKSTLLRVIVGLLSPSSGRVLMSGRPPAYKDEGFRRRIGYAGHSSGLYPSLTLLENLSLFARLYGVGQARVSEVLHSVGLSDRRDVPVGDLSAGFKRRAAVARAVLHEPDILLLDEPYANLDDEASALVSDAVKEWSAPGRVAVIATHGAKRVKAYADAGIILKNGRVGVAGVYGDRAVNS